MRRELYKVLEVAASAASDAAAVHRANIGAIESDDWSEKGRHDFVTRVDREAEVRAIERIRTSFPRHRILSEEAATAPPAEPGEAGVVRNPFAIPADRLAEAKREAGWVWVIDPLDGTTNYLHRYPMYAVSVAALLDGEPAVGVVMNGVTGETWTAVRGGGAFLDGAPIRVSEVEQPSRALVGTGFPFKALELLPRYLEDFSRILTISAGVRRAGSAALDLCHLATGYFDAFWELSLAPWDVAAGALIVREAGGVITRIDGEEDVVGNGSVLASNGRLHQWLVSILRDH